MISIKYLSTSVLAALALFASMPGFASAFQGSGKSYVANVEAHARLVAGAVEQLQEDIVAELSGGKERRLFQQVDQILHELTRMEHLPAKTPPTRTRLYKQFESLDAKLTALKSAIPEFVPKNHVILLRSADRVRALTDDLHFAVSQGDTSPMRLRQVVARQAHAMSDATQKLSRTAQYALADTPGRGELQTNLKNLANAAKKFEEAAASDAAVEKCKKDFAALNAAWMRVVRGVSLLPPDENVYLIRSGMRADSIHERLFQALDMPGERSKLTIRIGAGAGVQSSSAGSHVFRGTEEALIGSVCPIPYASSLTALAIS